MEIQVIPDSGPGEPDALDAVRAASGMAARIAEMAGPGISVTVTLKPGGYGTLDSPDDLIPAKVLVDCTGTGPAAQEWDSAITPVAGTDFLKPPGEA